MKKKIELEFCFKGSRKYVQGPDIFDAVIEYLMAEFSSINRIKYTAYEMLHKNASLIITDRFVKSEYSTINSLITFIGDETKYHAIICANDNNIECATEYSEAIVQNNSKINGKSIVFKNILINSFTETAVSMNKHYLNKTVDADGKWIVTKFDYAELADIMKIEQKNIKIELLQNFNNKLTKSLLYLDGKKVGFLYFSLIPKES